MADYKIFTDSTCDVKKEILEEWGAGYFNLTFYFTDDEERQYNDMDMPAADFYREMRNGRIAKTAGTNIEIIKEAFRKELLLGHDILYLGFSSALSSTYNSGVIAAEELSEEFPERTIFCVDTLSQSAGQAMLLRLTLDQKEAGATLAEAREYAESMKLKIAHWFSVDDLTYLERGGRLSKASLVIATVLNIKPILHTDPEGKLVAVEKVRGRKKSIQSMIDKYGELAENPGTEPVYFCHSDAEEDILYMKDLFREKYGIEPSMILDVGPVIGSHIGPGTVAIFYVAKER